MTKRYFEGSLLSASAWMKAFRWVNWWQLPSPIVHINMWICNWKKCNYRENLREEIGNCGSVRSTKIISRQAESKSELCLKIILTANLLMVPLTLAYCTMILCESGSVVGGTFPDENLVKLAEDFPCRQYHAHQSVDTEETALLDLCSSQRLPSYDSHSIPIQQHA